MKSNPELKIRRPGSGRTKGSVSFYAIKARDLRRLIDKMPTDGVVLIGRLWADAMITMGILNQKTVNKLSKNG